MPCSIATAPVLPGVTCPSASVISAWCICAICAGVGAVCGNASSKLWPQDADNEYAMIDSTIVRAHQHSSGAKGGARHKP